MDDNCNVKEVVIPIAAKYLNSTMIQFTKADLKAAIHKVQKR